MKTHYSLGTAIAPVCGLLAALAITPAAQAQFTYTGGTLNGAQTYDGTGVDSAMNPRTIGSTTDNDYIGSGAAGSLTVQSGTLTINNSDMKIGRNSGGNGAVTVQSGATLNINQIGDWGGGVGQSTAGSITINGGTLNWQTSGAQEQRFMLGNSGGGVGTLNLNGGTLHNYLDPAQAVTDTEAQFRMGSDGGQGIAYLNSGSWILSGNVPFFLGGKYQNNGATVVQSATVSTLNILDGSFIFTGIFAPLDATKSTFTVGENDLINFVSGDTGSLSLQGWAQSDFLALATSGKLEIDGSLVSDLSGFQYNSSGGQGILTLAPVPEPSTVTLACTGGLLLGMMLRRRRA